MFTHYRFSSVDPCATYPQDGVATADHPMDGLSFDLEEQAFESLTLFYQQLHKVSEDPLLSDEHLVDVMDRKHRVFTALNALRPL